MTGLNSMICRRHGCRPDRSSPLRRFPPFRQPYTKSLTCNAAPLLPLRARAVPQSGERDFIAAVLPEKGDAGVAAAVGETKRGGPARSLRHLDPGSACSACPAACPRMLTPKATPCFGPPESGDGYDLRACSFPHHRVRYPFGGVVGVGGEPFPRFDQPIAANRERLALLRRRRSPPAPGPQWCVLRGIRGLVRVRKPVLPVWEPRARPSSRQARPLHCELNDMVIFLLLFSRP